MRLSRAKIGNAPRVAESPALQADSLLPPAIDTLELIHLAQGNGRRS